ncbi:BspA family leucine-rich repeat surface protein [Lactobacillus melliventris]|uniref:Bacterial surface protein 26-residue PARCEL repeat (3 repeats) n=1 Tax=Lactobacillus melliventris TaxID=1218507 RepID=A0A0F4LBX4_9LACO|nr:BspA family leucine-rich repeat surface protein [Lactobacillus melliventris]KJY55813.1 Bacterial surface protein 26-residue PARCEL repeat (3 repeats) [Lactobacillus melliventris]
MNKHHFRIKLTTYLATIAMTVVGLSIIKPQTIFASASPPANLAKETKIATRDIQTVPWVTTDDSTDTDHIRELSLSYDSTSKTLTIPGSSKAFNDPQPLADALTDAGLDPANVNHIVIQGPLALSGSVRYLFGGSASELFREFNNITNIDGLDKLDTSKVTDMTSMFSKCFNLSDVNLKNFNTANVTTMSSMFYGCFRLKNIDVSSFNTENVSELSGMFEECRSLNAIDLSNFKTSKVTNISTMFQNCRSLKSIKFGEGFKTDNVTDMNGVFNNCLSLTDLDVSGFSTANVKTMSYMFGACQSLTKIDVSNFNTDKVTVMNNMFMDCENITELDLSKFNTANVFNMKEMFQYDFRLQRLDISGFDMSKIIYISDMLNDLQSLNLLKLGKDNIVKGTGLNTDGTWINVADGTLNEPKGKNRWSSKELMAKYVPANDADTYVREGTHFDEPKPPVNPPTPTPTPTPPSHSSGTIEPIAGAEVRVHYEDKNGLKLTPDKILNGNVGDGYVTQELKFAGYLLKARPYNSTGFFSYQPQTVTYTYLKGIERMVMHNSYLYDINGKRVTGKLMQGQMITTYDTETINGQKYYLLDNNTFVKATNITGQKRKLKHNALIYNQKAKKIRHASLKRGRKVRTYGGAVKRKGRYYYIIGLNRYVKKANF